MTRWFATRCALALGCGLYAGAAGAAPASVYTAIQKCPAARLQLPALTLERGVHLCKGAGGYSVYVVSESDRSWLALRRAGRLFPLQEHMTVRFEAGHFPNVDGGKVVEWRVSETGAPFALIARIAYQDKDDAFKSGSTLIVYDLTADAPAFLGYFSTNEAARAAANGLAR